MKILVANIPAAHESSEGGDFIKTVLVPLLRRNFDLVKGSDTEIIFRFPSQGVTMDIFADCRYLPKINGDAIFPAIVRAEEEGFDAAVIACFGNPMLWELRQTVNIPVASVGEGSLITAAMMGYKIGIISPHPLLNEPMKQMMAQFGLSDRLAGVRATPETAAQQEMALTDAKYGIECFKKLARELIEDGAEALIPGCGLMSPALRLAPGAEKEHPNGLTHVDDVPVIDIMAAGLKMAETLFSLKQAGSLWVNRKGFSSRGVFIEKRADQIIRENEGQVFWDC